MTKSNPQPGGRVILTKLPPGLIDGLPPDDQNAIIEVVGKPIVLTEYDDAGRAELEFVDATGDTHFIYVDPSFITPAK